MTLSGFTPAARNILSKGPTETDKASSIRRNICSFRCSISFISLSIFFTLCRAAYASLRSISRCPAVSLNTFDRSASLSVFVMVENFGLLSSDDPEFVISFSWLRFSLAFISSRREVLNLDFTILRAEVSSLRSISISISSSCNFDMWAKAFSNFICVCLDESC